MISPVKNSEVAEQIERARLRIERWPEWLKDAVGVGGKEPVESTAQKRSSSRPRLSDADFID